MTDLPEHNILEVSLIGTGGGYGESVVIHLGHNNWIVVDSCYDPTSAKCLPLEYLKSKGVDIEHDVKLIICTHWHNDHIIGISELLRSCKSSKFCMAQVTDTTKFLQLVELDYNKLKGEASATSTSEIKNCLEIIRSRNSKSEQSVIIRAVQDKILSRFDQDDIISKIFALSPSDFVVNEFDRELSTLLSDFGCSNSKIVIQKPNNKSVALLISVNTHYVLLGSDLEVSRDGRKGWLCILDRCNCIKNQKSSLFKIPHHGSQNGFHERIWEELIEPNSIANLTPWNLNGKLPEEKMLEKYLSLTENLYITSLNSKTYNPKKRERSISKAISKFNSSLHEVKFSYGIVRCRLDVLRKESEWQVDLFGEASKISKELLKKN
jgi:beta-lactamase superfamily II metal-dependent hydrolase